MAALTPQLAKVAAAIRAADALIVTAGAGMGVDSGLPDFRGVEGFWRAYPPLRQLGLSLPQMSTPHWFQDNPRFAWAFFAHRARLYRETQPHEGFQLLQNWGKRMKHGMFVMTSNVDGQFQKAGVPEDRICECHGTLFKLQCTQGCPRIFATDYIPPVDMDKFLVPSEAPLPECPSCKALARPNVLMFDDSDWIPDHTNAQERRLHKHLADLPDDTRIVVVEMGAGKAIPTIRLFSERLAGRGATLVRIYPADSDIPAKIRNFNDHVQLPLGALAGLRGIQEQLDLV